MQSLQDESKPAAGRYPPAAGDADLEAGSLAEMPAMPERSVCTTGADDQADAIAEPSPNVGLIIAGNCHLGEITGPLGPRAEPFQVAICDRGWTLDAHSVE